MFAPRFPGLRGRDIGVTRTSHTGCAARTAAGSSTRHVYPPGVLRSVINLCTIATAAITATIAAVAWSAPSAGAVTGSSANNLLQQSLNAANGASSMLFVDHTTTDGTTQTIQGAISAPTASETFTEDGASLEVELINGVVYVYGPAGLIINALGISTTQAAAAADKWVAVHSSDAPFDDLTGDLTIDSTLDEFTPSAHLREQATTKVGLVKAIPIVGSPSSSVSEGTKGSVALFVSPKGRHLPVGGSLVLGDKQDHHLDEVAVFKDWGVPVKLTPPSGAIPFSSILQD